MAQIAHSPFAIATNVHGAFTKQSLRSVGIPAAVLSTLSRFTNGGPLAARRTHPWQPYLVWGDHLWQHNREFAADGPGGPVVAGDQLRRDSSHIIFLGATIINGYLLRHTNILACLDLFSKIVNLSQPKSYFTLHLSDPN